MSTRTERFEARMKTLEGQITVATKLATTMIKDYKEASKAKAPEGTPDPLVQALGMLHDKCDKLVEPMAILLKLQGVKGVDEAVAAVEAKPERSRSRDDSFPFAKLAMIKINTNPNSHRYPLGQPLIILGGDHAAYFDEEEKSWKPGNHLPDGIGHYESVTGSEMERAFDTLDTFPFMLIESDNE